jgi:membrane fusion protein (multidrug efflux system)
MPDASGQVERTAMRGTRARRLLRAVLLVVVPLVAVVVGAYYYAASGRYVSTENAYLRADRVAVSADVSGRVVTVAVRENQIVAAGAELFRIDDAPFRIALARAEAQLQSVRNEIEAQRANYRSRLEQVRLAELSVAFSEREAARHAELLQRGATPQTRYSEARQAASVARQQWMVAREELAHSLASLGGAPDTPTQQHPRYRDAEAQRDQASLDLRRTVVAAPWAGVVSRIDRFRPGEYVSAGAPVFALMANENLWIEANVKETALTHVRPGQEATVTIDAYPNRIWHARVSSIGAATGAEFSVLPAQNATGNWVKIVQRVPIQLAIELQPDQPLLRAGMSVVVEIDTGHRPSVADLIGSAFAWVGMRP